MAPRISSLEKVLLSMLIPAVIVIAAVLVYSLLQYQRIVVPSAISDLFVIMLGLTAVSGPGLLLSLFVKTMRQRHGRKWWRRIWRQRKKRVYGGYYDI